MHFCRRKAAEFYTEEKQRMSKTKKRILTGIILAVILIAAGIFTYVEIRDAETIKAEDINKLPSTVLVGYLESEGRYVKLAEVNTLSKYSDKLKYKLDPNGNRIKDAEGHAFKEEDPDGNELTNFYAYYSKENPGEEIRIHAVEGTPEEAAKQSGFTDAEETTVSGKTGYLGSREDGEDLILGFFIESPYREFSIATTITMRGSDEREETEKIEKAKGILDSALTAFSPASGEDLRIRTVKAKPEEAAKAAGFAHPEETTIAGKNGWLGTRWEMDDLIVGFFAKSASRGYSISATVALRSEKDTEAELEPEAETGAADADTPESIRAEKAMSLLQGVMTKVTPEKQMAQIAKDFKENFLDDNRWTFLTNGLLATMEITLFAVLLGIAIGVLVATVRSTWDQNAENMRPGSIGKALLGGLNGICKTYLTVIRGTPVVVQLMIIYYVIFKGAQNGVLIGSLAFGINSGAYVAEIIRGGIMSVDRGQLEAGRSLGFNYVQTMRHIIVPQALKSVLPALANEFIVLLKETSVAGYVAVMDLTKGGETIRGLTYSPFMPLLAVALIYLVVVMFFTWLVGKLERRLRSSDH